MIKNLNREPTFTNKAMDAVFMITFTVGYQTLTLAQGGFMFVSALQTNELISAWIEGNLTKQEMLFKMTAILVLIPLTLVFAIWKHCYIQTNHNRSERLKHYTDSDLASSTETSSYLFNNLHM